MMDESIVQALALVKAQAAFRPMTVEEVSSMARSLASAINEIKERGSDSPAASDWTRMWRSDKDIACLVCGKKFKMVTRRHLRNAHGLTPEAYREMFNIPKDVSLVCEALHKERSKKMKGMKLWEKRRPRRAKK
jgi:predicted transcriptional regulator